MEENMGKYSIKIKTNENGWKDEIKISRNVENDIITWKEILVATMDALTGMGYIISEDIREKVLEDIDYEM